MCSAGLPEYFRGEKVRFDDHLWWAQQSISYFSDSAQEKQQIFLASSRGMVSRASMEALSNREIVETILSFCDEHRVIGSISTCSSLIRRGLLSVTHSIHGAWITFDECDRERAWQLYLDRQMAAEVRVHFESPDYESS